MNIMSTALIRGLLAATLFTLAAATAPAQTPDQAVEVEVAPEEWTYRSPEELEELVGPIALYPDDLVGIILPASTYPLQIVQAARFLERLESDSTLEPSEDWEDSVVALLNYPQVLAMMSEDLDWTWALGEAVLAQQDDVLAAIQDFRNRAYAAGNLRTDERQVVRQNEEIIEIAPADPEVIYVPYYEPQRVVVYQPAPVIYYYPYAYPVYYYPYPLGYHFRTRHFWGVTTWFSVGWRTRFVHVHHHHFFGHPFYGYDYYWPFYVRQPGTFVNVNVHVHRGNPVWRPAPRGGVRPRSDHFVRDDRGTWTRSGDWGSRADGRPRPAPTDRRAAWERSRGEQRIGARTGDDRVRELQGAEGRESQRRDWQRPNEEARRSGQGNNTAERAARAEQATRPAPATRAPGVADATRYARPSDRGPITRPGTDAPAVRSAPQSDRAAAGRPQPGDRPALSGGDRSLPPGLRSSSTQGARQAAPPTRALPQRESAPQRLSVPQRESAPQRLSAPQRESASPRTPSRQSMAPRAAVPQRAPAAQRAAPAERARTAAPEAPASRTRGRTDSARAGGVARQSAGASRARGGFSIAER